MEHNDEEIGVSEITIAELIYGAYHSSNFKKHRREADFLAHSFAVFNISECLDEYGEIRDFLEKQGKKIDNFDLLIAATALHYGLTVVTDNIRHFMNIPNLKVENWVSREQP